MADPRQLLKAGKAAQRAILRAAEKGAVREIGQGLSRLALKKAGARIAGKIAVGSRYWKRAFEHISEHFVENLAKPSHAVFLAKNRSKDAVEALIQRAASKPSQKFLTKATIQGNPTGRPVVVLEREFAEIVGQLGKEECRILRIVVDFTGRPITAYPISKFGTP